MQGPDLERALGEARKGDELARRRLVEHYKPYIINTVGHLCRRFITWSDDEASIGLIAFNRAIDTFDPGGGRGFLNYAYLLIERDLIDYFRREGRQKHLALDGSGEEEDPEFSRFEVEKATEDYERSVERTELVEEILELDEALAAFGIRFEDLQRSCPRHRDTREALLEMATVFASDPELVRELIHKKFLPVKTFSERYGYRRKTVERHRGYLITLITIRLHPEWVYLSSYIKRERGNLG